MFYVLAFFLFFLSWFHASISSQLSEIKIDHYRILINDRLDIEEEIIKSYRFDVELVNYEFSMHDSFVSCEKVDQIIYINISGNIRMDFKYDIIEDGSFIYSQWGD